MREIRLHNNESPFKPESLVNSLFDFDYEQFNLNLYISQEEGPLLDSLAKYTKVDKEMIIAANGGDTLLGDIFNSLSGDTRKVLISSPTFFLYNTIANRLRLEIVDVPLRKDFSLDVDNIINKARDTKTELIVICRPNNPTGNVFPRKDVIKIIENVKAYVLVDEAYYEFAEDTLADQLDKYDNLVILRTFSKAFAAAGLRLGYGLANKEVREQIRKFQTYYNVSNMAQLIGVRLLENSQSFKPYIENMKKLRDDFLKKLNEIEDVFAYDSETNFLLVCMDVDFDAFADYLQEKNILVRKVHNLCEMTNDTVRVSVSNEKDNDEFVRILKEYLA
jgi:histidinol-phosphate aminotransferase